MGRGVGAAGEKEGGKERVMKGRKGRVFPPLVPAPIAGDSSMAKLSPAGT